MLPGQIGQSAGRLFQGIPGAVKQFARAPATLMKEILKAEKHLSQPNRQEDSFSISFPLRQLLDTGLDLDRSSFSEQSELMSFDLNFSSQSFEVEGLRSNGYYDLSASSLQIDFSFQSSLEVMNPDTGERTLQFFQFDFHLEASQVSLDGGEQRTEKEDVGRFALDILSKIKAMEAEGKDIDGLVLEQEDLKDLAAADGGKLLKRIMHTLNLLRGLHHLRGEEREHTWLEPGRDKALVSETMTQEFEEFSFSLSVARIEQQEAAAEAVVEAAEQVSG